jgi:hypothetical protein
MMMPTVMMVDDPAWRRAIRINDHHGTSDNNHAGSWLATRRSHHDHPPRRFAHFARLVVNRCGRHRWRV